MLNPQLVYTPNIHIVSTKETFMDVIAVDIFA